MSENKLNYKDAVTEAAQNGIKPVRYVEAEG